MRQKRVKTYRKVMKLYCSSFGFREPYQLLVDAAFTSACIQQKLDFQARLEDVLQGAVKPMITQCCMQTLYDLGDEGKAAVELAKGFERRKCNHFKPRPEEECMTTMAGDDNKNRYVIATQSLDLRKKLRTVPGLPIVYIARSVVLLENPSDQTLSKKAAMEKAKLHVPASEKSLLSKTASAPSNSSNLIDSHLSDLPPVASTSDVPIDGDAATPEEPAKKKKKKKGPPGPNPLSVKKKKKVEPSPGDGRRPKRARDGEEEGDKKKVEERKKPRLDSAAGQVPTMARRGDARGAVADSGGGDAQASKRKRKRSGKKATGGEGAEGGEAAATAVSTE